MTNEDPPLNNRKVKNRIRRQQAHAVQIRGNSWAPEIVGIGLLTIALLTSAGLIG